MANLVLFQASTHELPPPSEKARREVSFSSSFSPLLITNANGRDRVLKKCRKEEQKKEGKFKWAQSWEIFSLGRGICAGQISLSFSWWYIPRRKRGWGLVWNLTPSHPLPRRKGRDIKPTKMYYLIFLCCSPSSPTPQGISKHLYTLSTIHLIQTTQQRWGGGERETIVARFSHNKKRSWMWNIPRPPIPHFLPSPNLTSCGRWEIFSEAEIPPPKKNIFFVGAA